ncbi:MAG: phage major capsid protein [Actinomycetota bacterium]|nr:phage major capsid protein [Actinomycetota bacterium]
MAKPHHTLPRENLVRAMRGITLKRDAGDDSMPTMGGHFAVFNRFTEINSMFEGNFLERLAPGSFRKTIRENRDKIKVLFNHGQDPQIGDKVLGPIRDLAEDGDVGVAYEVPLFDTSYNRDLIPGLEAGVYGASFRFKVMREEIREKPEPSEENPKGLPERTIKEVSLAEFGPVTFPAYPEATAGLRSMTDEFLVAAFAEQPERLAELITQNTRSPGTLSVTTDPQTWTTSGATGIVVPQTTTSTTVTTLRSEDAPDPDGAEPDAHPAESRREPDAPDTTTKEGTTMQTVEELRARLAEIAERLKGIGSEAGTERFTEAAQAEWDGLLDERAEIEARISAVEERRKVLEDLNRAGQVETPEPPGKPAWDGGSNVRTQKGIPANLYDVSEYRTLNRWEDVPAKLQQGARRAIEIMQFPHERAEHEKQQAHLTSLLRELDGEDARLSRHILETASPLYARAFGKYLAQRPLTAEEDNALKRAASLTTTAGGFAVPVTLDPTVMLTSDGQINPVRGISRVVTVAGNTWEGITSAGITASYAAETTEAGDDAPTIAQPSITAEKAQAFVPFSIEIGEDWAGFQSEMARLIQDAKDSLEADKFTTGVGSGSNEPQGYLVGATAVVTTAATATLAVADLYSGKNALPPRYRPNASWVAEGTQFDRIRQFDTSGGASLWAFLGDGTPDRLLGRPAYENSSAPSTVTTGSSAVTYGDFSAGYVIVDKVGLSVELIPHMFATANNRPSGQRGLYAYWRNSAEVVAWQAFRTIKTL